jgi:hypothetical protein
METRDTGTGADGSTHPYLPVTVNSHPMDGFAEGGHP